MAGCGAARGLVAPHCRAAFVEAVTSAVAAFHSAWSSRAERLWIALVAIPLAEIASGLVGEWWTWPVLAVCAWTCTPSWRWLWLLSVELGFVGVMWAAVGATPLAHLPNDRLVVGAIWAAFPLALAGAGWMNRRRSANPGAYFSLR
jgi:hypothetical protein